MAKVETDLKHNMLLLHHPQDGQLRFPFVWLRHNCKCESCFNPKAKARLMWMMHLDLDIQPRQQEVTDTDNVTITWADGHQSTYNIDWLRQNCFSEAAISEREEFYQLKPKLWGVEIKDKLPTTTYEEFMSSDSAMYQSLVDLEVYGICLMTGAPKQENVVEILTNKIGFMRKTVYGLTFHIKGEGGIDNLAFSKNELPMHIDQPYTEFPPGVQLLHCFSQTPSDGGENYFCDGFKVANTIKEEYPEYFKLLSTVPVFTQNEIKMSYKFHLLAKHKMIQLADDGSIEQVSYNAALADFDVPLDKVQDMYAATVVLERMLYDQRHFFQIKLNEGDVVFFHNKRVFHGRTAFTVPAGHSRHMIGGNIDWDQVRSMRRVLQKELGLWK